MNAATAHARFVDALLDPTRALPEGLRPGDARRRFAVHRNNVAASLADALATGFPVTAALLGEDCFRALALAYVRMHPPRSPQLRLHGADLPGFIADRFMTDDLIRNDFATDGFTTDRVIENGETGAALDCMADVARLEFLRMHAFHACDARPLPTTEFTALLAQPERLADSRAHLHPACRWLRSRHAVLAIWQAHQGDDDGDALAQVDPDCAQDVLVLRPALDIDMLVAPPGGVTLLQTLHAGRTLRDAIADALREPDATLDDLLSLLITPGVLAELVSRESPRAPMGAAMAASAPSARDRRTEPDRGRGRLRRTTCDERSLRARRNEDPA